MEISEKKWQNKFERAINEIGNQMPALWVDNKQKVKVEIARTRLPTLTNTVR